MLKILARAGLGVLALTALAGPAAAQMGADAGACRAGHPAILVNVAGLKQRTGNIRVALYGNPTPFLQRGQTMRKVNVPVTANGPMRVCIAVPRSEEHTSELQSH